MIFEFICYPNEFCYRPHETIGHCYQERDFIESVVDDYSFINAPIGDGFNKVGHDFHYPHCLYQKFTILSCFISNFPGGRASGKKVTAYPQRG